MAINARIDSSPNYVVLLDHEGGKEPILKDNKVVVFNKDGDSIMSHSTRTLGNAVKDACAVIASDWPKQQMKAGSDDAKVNGSDVAKKRE